jgi:hypothetical protein
MATVEDLTRQLGAVYAALPAVEAVALGGSRAGPFETDADADVDLYVYRRG